MKRISGDDLQFFFIFGFSTTGFSFELMSDSRYRKKRILMGESSFWYKYAAFRTNSQEICFGIGGKGIVPSFTVLWISNIRRLCFPGWHVFFRAASYPLTHCNPDIFPLNLKHLSPKKPGGDPGTEFLLTQRLGQIGGV
jgi:hypothetical protein